MGIWREMGWRLEDLKGPDDGKGERMGRRPKGWKLRP
jgi:hypothetical protein